MVSKSIRVRGKPGFRLEKWSKKLRRQLVYAKKVSRGNSKSKEKYKKRVRRLAGQLGAITREVRRVQVGFDFENAFEISTQTAHSTRQTKGVEGLSFWDFEVSGTFGVCPSPEVLEKMVSNSLVAAFNKGVAGNNNFVPGPVFAALVENAVRGFEVRRTYVRRRSIGNKFSVQLKITGSSGNVWQGTN